MRLRTIAMTAVAALALTLGWPSAAFAAAPTATIVVEDTVLAIGGAADVTITFSEAVIGFSTADLIADNGTISGLSTGDGGVTWTATLTPLAKTYAFGNVITLDNTGVRNGDGDVGVGSTNSNIYVVDTVRPTANISLADTDLAAGETSRVTITFSEAVTGFTNADLSVANGALGTVSSSGGDMTWTTTFTPNANVADSTNVITLDDSGVSDAAGNAGTGWTDSANYTVNTVRPTATIMVAKSMFVVGDTANVTFTFSEAVIGFDNSDLTVANGTLNPVSSINGGRTWTATFTPTGNVAGSTGEITLDNTGVVADGSGNAGAGLTSSNSYTVDTRRPTATIVLADNALAIGETSDVTITFSEAVIGFDNSDLTVVNGILSAVSSSDGGVTWTATFTPVAGISASSNVITLDNAGVSDLAGNLGSGSTDSNNFVLDAQRPTATIVLSQSSLKADETALVTVTFSESVTGFDNSDLSIANGTLTNVGSSDGGITWTATFTPHGNVSDPTNLISLNNPGVRDVAGNAGTGVTNSANYAVDTVRPTAKIVLADTALVKGETSLVTITFSEAVAAFTNANLAVANGALTPVSSSDGGVTWTATFAPAAEVSSARNVIALDLANVSDLAGNTGAGTATSDEYSVETVTPAPVTSNTVTGATAAIKVPAAAQTALAATGAEAGGILTLSALLLLLGATSLVRRRVSRA